MRPPRFRHLWLKQCSDCLSLRIVLLNKNMQSVERDRQELCVIQKTRQAAVTLLKMLNERKLRAEKCGMGDFGDAVSAMPFRRWR